MDMLVNETHEKNMNIDIQERYTDTHPLERARGVSIKSMPMTLVMQDTKDVSYLLNIIDTPGKKKQKRNRKYDMLSLVSLCQQGFA